MLVVMVRKGERGMRTKDDDGGWDGDVEGLEESKVVRGGTGERDEGSEDYE